MHIPTAALALLGVGFAPVALAGEVKGNPFATGFSIGPATDGSTSDVKETFYSTSAGNFRDCISVGDGKKCRNMRLEVFKGARCWASSRKDVRCNCSSSKDGGGCWYFEGPAAYRNLADYDNGTLQWLWCNRWE